MSERPTAQELTEAILEFLGGEILPTLTDQRLRFRMLVAMNALGIVHRELEGLPVEDDSELRDMLRRFRASIVLTAPLLLLGMSDLLPGRPVQHALSPALISWIELALATPVVLWGGRPFFERGWASVSNRSLNMFTLIALGRASPTSSAW